MRPHPVKPNADDCPNWQASPTGRLGCWCSGRWCDYCRMMHQPHRSASFSGHVCGRCGHKCGLLGPHGFTTCEWRANALPIIELGFSLDYVESMDVFARQP